MSDAPPDPMPGPAADAADLNAFLQTWHGAQGGERAERRVRGPAASLPRPSPPASPEPVSKP